MYRLGYLKGLAAEKNAAYVLIAPGLHDGKAVLDMLGPRMRNETNTTFLFCPHPLANNSYLANGFKSSNVQIPAEETRVLLGKVGKVYVTYSSIGVEARALGIEVEVLDIPGKVNESALADCLSVT